MRKLITKKHHINKPWQLARRGLLPLLVSLMILNSALTASAFMDSAPDWTSSALAPTYPGVANGLELRQSLQFADLGQHWAKDSIIRVAAQGLMRGYGNHRFRPNQALTRQEVITGLVQALGREAEALAAAETGTQNLGVIRADSWAAGFLQAAISAEIITADEFNAKDWRETATREELALWIGRAIQLQPVYGAERRTIYSFRDANEIDLAAAPWVEAVLRENLMYGAQANLFDPKGPMTRAQLAVMCDRLSPRLHLIRGVTEHWGIVED
ncbi:MAG: S-layer homology domain-containing protein, partial [Syntrophomonadaceae bacterium]|nr:S-layer homology domain-containing protein [Syntrophomonadaceae bacterium]